MEITRRTLLKTGLAASAGLIFNDRALQAAVAEDPDDQKALPLPSSPRQRSLLDFGWRFHFGHAKTTAKDFSFGLPLVETTFAKAGQIIGHNAFNGGQVVPLQIDDSSWRVVDLPHDWAVELPLPTWRNPTFPPTPRTGESLGTRLSGDEHRLVPPEVRRTRAGRRQAHQAGVRRGVSGCDGRFPTASISGGTSAVTRRSSST